MANNAVDEFSSNQQVVYSGTFEHNTDLIDEMADTFDNRQREMVAITESVDHILGSDG